MIPGVKGSATSSVDSTVKAPGEAGVAVGLTSLLSESPVTGRMVEPLRNGELDPDLGDRGVKGLCPSELWPPGERGDESLPLFESDLNELTSRVGKVEFRDGMLTE